MISKLAVAEASKAVIKSGMKSKTEKPLHVVKIRRIPYGLFEKQLWEYFTQFGKVVRVRVARSCKTGNHKGWAFVGFENKDVAEIAAESMNGYLMFEKRLSCHVMDPEKVPKSMKSGPRYVAPPHMRGRAKKEALKRNKGKSDEQEKKIKARREAAQKRRLNKLKSLGIEYELGNMPSSASKADTSEIKTGENSEDELLKSEESDAPHSPLPVKRKKAVKSLVPKLAKVKSRKPTVKKVKKMKK